MTQQKHWDRIYGQKGAEGVSWYRPHLDRSLEFIDSATLSKCAAILDVGGGTSTLVDDLLARGYSDVTVLDISPSAVERAKQRLGSRAERVTWIVGDITRVELPEHRFDIWHDRAVFHFLTDPLARERYVAAVQYALKPNGHVLVATFGLEGPERCSGLPVVRYSSEGIHAQFGPGFTKIGSATEVHPTPAGLEQEFVYCFCKRVA